MSALQVTSSSSLAIIDSTIAGTVWLRDAVIAGSLRLSGTTIDGDTTELYGAEQKVAVHAPRLRTTGHCVLDRGFTAQGAVFLDGSIIAGNLLGMAGHFLNPGGVALQAQSLELAGSAVLIDGFEAEGQVNVNRARAGCTRRTAR